MNHSKTTFESLVVSVGGNALKTSEGSGISHQREAAKQAAEVVANLYRQCIKMALVHGNGPQAGFILESQAAAAKQGVSYLKPIDVVVADTQGSIGYMLAQELGNQGLSHDVVALLTQVLVNPDDPAFQNPTKPIGSWMTKAEAAIYIKENTDWVIQNLRPNEFRGHRRVVASPRPIGIIEERQISHNFDAGFLTIAGGGGGIPVHQNTERNIGVEAVIDKDLTSALMARLLRADLLLILTEVPGVMDPEEFRKNGIEGEIYSTLSVDKGREMLVDMEKGSMGPKLEACIEFVEQTGKPAIITNFKNAEQALMGQAGTLVQKTE